MQNIFNLHGTEVVACVKRADGLILDSIQGHRKT